MFNNCKKYTQFFHLTAPNLAFQTFLSVASRISKTSPAAYLDSDNCKFAIFQLICQSGAISFDDLEGKENANLRLPVSVFGVIFLQFLKRF